VTKRSGDQPVTRPTGQVTNWSGDQLVNEGVTNLSGGDDQLVMSRGDQLVNQDKKANREENKELNQEETASPEIVMPWESEAFAEAWALWKDERKAKRLRKYTPRGEQAQLHKLQTECGTEEAAIAAIHHSIAQGYQGIFPDRATKQNTPRPAPDGGHFVGNVYVPNIENIYKNG
jgi:endonuclease I